MATVVMNDSMIDQALRELSRVDADMAREFARLGAPEPRVRPTGFVTLLNIIVSQQISTEAAKAIMARVSALMDEATPTNLLKLQSEDLRQAGLSMRKAEYALGLAEEMESGVFCESSLDTLDDDEAINAITRLRGFGRWSAEVYLMFSLGRQDLFPADDLALRVALGRLKGLDERPTAKQSRQLVEHWQPWRTVGSLFLWHYYRGAPT